MVQDFAGPSTDGGSINGSLDWLDDLGHLQMSDRKMCENPSCFYFRIVILYAFFIIFQDGNSCCIIFQKASLANNFREAKKD